MVSGRSFRSRKAALSTALALAATLMALPSSGALAGGFACSVENVTAAAHYSTLQTAVDAASAGDVLRMTGICYGSTIIDRNLTIGGHRSLATGVATLDAGSLGRVVTVEAEVVVTIQRLTIRHGIADGSVNPSSYGGGISNNGRLTLRNVIVRGNEGYYGGGISDSGSLTLTGATSVFDNSAEMANGATGGGIYVHGQSATLTMDGTSSVHDNIANNDGGGIYVARGSVILNDSNSVFNNESAVPGGGIYAGRGSVTLNDSSSVFGNRAGGPGGGIYVICGLLIGAVAGTNVYGNHPNDVRVVGC